MTNQIEPAGSREAARYRYTVKTYLRSRGMDPATYSLEALQELGKLTARLARQEGWEERKVAEDGFTVHSWPLAVYEAVAAGQRGDVPPATPRQLAYLGALAGQRWIGRLLERLDSPINMDEAGDMIERLKARRSQTTSKARPSGNQGFNLIGQTWDEADSLYRSDMDPGYDGDG